MTSRGPAQTQPFCVILCFALTPKAPQPSPDACWKGCWDKGGSQTPPRGFITKQRLPSPQQHMADTVRREKRSFYCGHQVREPSRSRSASGRTRRSAPARPESESWAQSLKAGRGRMLFPCLWGTPLTRNCRWPRGESYCWQCLRQGPAASPPRVMPLETGERAEMRGAPVPRSRAPWGAPGELPRSYCQTLRSTLPPRPLPASCTG